MTAKKYSLDYHIVRIYSAWTILSQIECLDQTETKTVEPFAFEITIDPGRKTYIDALTRGLETLSFGKYEFQKRRYLLFLKRRQICAVTQPRIWTVDEMVRLSKEAYWYCRKHGCRLFESGLDRRQMAEALGRAIHAEVETSLS